MSALGRLFKKEPTPREVARSTQRDLGRNVRDVEREIAALRREEQKLIKDIKATAKQGNTAGTRILAQQLVRLRGQITRMHTTQAQLRGVGISVTTAATTSMMGQSLGQAGAAMAKVGAAADPRKVQHTMAQFSRENAKMEMAGEMMDGALEDALDGDGVEDETEEVVAQVLDEIGVDLGAQLGAAPKQRAPAQRQAAPAAAEEDELIARLTALK
ncbi:vacuolar sorting-associated 2-like protein 3 [Micractinium conductrix]|uniref:Vacuolar sorting-associated 2-like protein 3 n=1 Tax=Micractinium conductrix TaxID=554055 RepID=A0A2P6VI35_9CHLO|nr:vacuolar sorting-associated 2-like protein 3 [Micractinium conductrix]|eukprot:PSC73754.1 vacuolar sorting-associated 2-like protein 3 [Micractinium conductrix]